MNRTLLKPLTTGVCHLLLLCTVFFSTTAHAVNITVTASRNPVTVDDSFHLVYEADSSVDGAPDFTPLYQNFDVLSSSQSTNMRSVNGNWTLKKSWDLAVIAKDIGKYTIPPISFGKDLSPAIQITVTSNTSSGSQSADGKSTIPAKIFLESSIDKKSGRVQSQFIYTVRLLRTVNITGGTLTEPETSDPDAIIHRIGEDQYQTTRKGVRYEVIERRYAIFPQKSGKLKINPVTFEGRINATQPKSIFDQFRMSGQLKRLRSKAVSADVKAAPANIPLQDFLPAINLEIIEEWSEDINNLSAGEPVTRTLTIVAEGLSHVQLPDLEIEEVDGLKQYPDKAITENRVATDNLTGLKQLKVAIIPASAGSYTLPELKLQWWNTKTGSLETARIAQTTLTVTGSVQSNEIPAPPLQNQNTGLRDTGNVENSVTQSLPPGAAVEAYWKWLTLLFATAWLVTLVILLNKRKGREDTPEAKPATSARSIKSAATEVKRHAGKNNAKDTKTALIAWAQLFYNDSELTNLSQISDHCSAEFSLQLRQLNQAIYSPEKTAWHGRELLDAFKQEQREAKKPKTQNSPALRPLYNK